MLKKFALTLLLLMMGHVANADCTYDGVTYPEGAIIGPYVCTGGQWVKR